MGPMSSAMTPLLYIYIYIYICLIYILRLIGLYYKFSFLLFSFNNSGTHAINNDAITLFYYLCKFILCWIGLFYKVNIILCHM